jgi:CheY-like chemotaxis protein
MHGTDATMNPSRASTDAAFVLVVDDHDDGRSFARTALEESGFVVTEAANGQAALELLNVAPVPNVVVLDLEMPVMSGTQLLEAMRGDDRLSRVRVLILSGSRGAVPRGGLVAGFLRKPCDPDDLVSAVTDCFDKNGS